MTQNIQLSVYPSDSGFIGKLILNTEHVQYQKSSNLSSKTDEISTIVVLDRSGSMGDSVPRLVNKIIPMVFESLKYSENDQITLITFDSVAKKHQMTIKEMRDFSIRCQGQTYMASAVQTLMNFIRNELPENCRFIRLLTVSDGEVADQDAVQDLASKLSALIKNDYLINSQAVRLFTSSSQPDTRAVSSLLQLNNTANVELLDLKTSLKNVEISSSISSLFSIDAFERNVTLLSEESIFKMHPWQTKTSSAISLFSGENLFWIEKIPNTKMFVGDIPVEIVTERMLNMETCSQLLKAKIDHYINQLKILKVVNTIESQTEITKILSYFQNMEERLCENDSDHQTVENHATLRARLEFLKATIQRRKRSFVMRMAQIANDDKVAKLNSAQQAEYLRSVDSSSKNARGLARRAVTQGLDFDEKLRQEVRQMAEHLHELKNIDDGDHLVSFYSQDTTLGGIRAVCQLVPDDMIDDVTATDILKMINIVGVACSAPIGEFPDPMTWRVNQIHIGCYVSLSDVLTAFLQSHGRPLLTPATNHEITNVIPMFDDLRILDFMKKYGPSLLEYTGSIGMRRVIADVPMTMGYTVCAAVWKLIEDLNDHRSQLHLETFEKVLGTYERQVGNYFQHIMPYLNEQTGPNSYYIANNGVTNMISPIIKLYRENHSDKLAYVPNILRALYTYEIWQGIRRQYKNRDDAEHIVQSMLDRLIGLDLDRYKVKLREPFEEEPNLSDILFHDEIHVDEAYLDELLKTVNYVDYLTLLPSFISAVVHSNRDELKAVKKMNDETICQALNISYSLRKFQFYNVIQALTFTSKASRVDTDKNAMKILDLIDVNQAECLLKDYIRKRFENQYATDLALKSRQERSQMVTELVQSIVSARKHETMIELLRDGLKRGKLHVAITNSSSLGFIELKNKLLDLNEHIPRRLDAIKVFLLARDYKNNDEPVWNNGNVLFTPDFQRFERIFIDLGFEPEWLKIKEEYLKRNLHVYRDSFNRHGHGNPKPSYWAYGFQTLQLYKDSVSEEIFKEYCEIHHDCCGTIQFKRFNNNST